MQKIILHLDMNSYFASVEQQANPHLRGRPVGVCEHLGGIIIAPSVEAKRAGIKLGTPVWEALPKCPAIVLLPTDPDKYRSVTERFNRILRDYTDEIERYSIDESFADITKCCGGDWDDALLIGLTIKQRLRHEVGEWVSCSIGIGPNKLIAKIAADLDHGVIASVAKQSQGYEIASSPEAPRNDKLLLDRICIIRPEDVPLLYDRLSLTDVPGIGKRLERSLNKLGMFTLRQLADYPLANLINRFGVWGWVLHGLGRFNFSPPREEGLGEVMEHHSNPLLISPSRGGEINTPDLPKSIGHAYTLPRVIRRPREIKGLMMKLAEKVGRRMRTVGARGNIVHYFHSDRQYDSYHQQRKLGEFVSGGREIYKAARGVFQGEGELGIKIMGITISGLVFTEPPEPLWPRFQKPRLLASAADKINDKYGDFTIYPGRLLGVPEEWGRDTVGFGRTKT